MKHLEYLVFTFFVLSYIQISESGPWCYSCEKVFLPAICGLVQKCADSEICFTAMHDGLNGGKQYRSGCMPASKCSINKTRRSVEPDDNPETCNECCSSDYCNSKLCGGIVITKADQKHCMKCEAVQQSTDCDQFELCGKDQQCFGKAVSHFNQNFYKLGCEDKTTCSRNNDVCCDTDMCNYDVNITFTTASIQSTTPTITIPTTAATTTLPTTTAATTTMPTTTAATTTLPTTTTTTTTMPTTTAATTTMPTTTAATTTMPTTTVATTTLPTTTVATTTMPTTTVATTTAATTTMPTTTAATTTLPTTQGIPPHISNTNQTVDVKMYDNVTLICNVTGSPKPTVSWKFGDLHVFNAKPVGNNLFIQHVTKENTGKYVCFAENNHGTAQITTELRVKEPLKVELLNPVTVIDPSDLHGIVRVNCKATGDPKPHVIWSKYNMPPIQTDTSHILFPNGDMIITGLNPGNIKIHQGIYVCKGDNGVDSAIAYQIIAGKIFFPLDETNTFDKFGLEPGEAYQAHCAPGTTVPDGSPINKEFNKDDKVCVAGRQVGVIGKDGGFVTWIIKPNGHPEIVDQSKGKIEFA